MTMQFRRQVLANLSDYVIIKKHNKFKIRIDLLCKKQIDCFIITRFKQEYKLMQP